MILAFKLNSDYAHFSYPYTIYSSLTYPIPPKTQIIGLLGAIGGFQDYLFLNDIRYSCKVLQIDGKFSFCFNGIKDVLKNTKETQIIKQRKQFYRELLINPQYEIYIDFSSVESKKAQIIINNIKNHIAKYPIYLGINIALANFEFLGEFESKKIETDEFTQIDSAILLDSKFEIESDKNYSDIRVATKIEANRIFRDFQDLLVETSGKSIKAKVDYEEVGDKNLIFI